LKLDELLDQLDESYHNATTVNFTSVEDALKVAGSALRWLTNQCEDEDEESSTDDDTSN
jgi:hypothetical protein